MDTEDVGAKASSWDEYDEYIAHRNPTKEAWKFALTGLKNCVLGLPLLLFGAIFYGSAALVVVFLALAIRTALVAWVLMILVGVLYSHQLLVTDTISYTTSLIISFLLVLVVSLLIPARENPAY